MKAGHTARPVRGNRKVESTVSSALGLAKGDGGAASRRVARARPTRQIGSKRFRRVHWALLSARGAAIFEGRSDPSSEL